MSCDTALHTSKKDQPLYLFSSHTKILSTILVEKIGKDEKKEELQCPCISTLESKTTSIEESKNIKDDTLHSLKKIVFCLKTS